MEKFDKVVYNLLSNAMKFTPEGGTISVRLKSEHNSCIFRVKTRELALLKNKFPIYLSAFVDSEGSANRSYEGSGLGLALVKELVELHGGQVTVESVYGQGTTFSLWLVTGNAHLPISKY